MAVATYGILALEISAAFAVFFPFRGRVIVLLLLVTFHVGIAVVMGLWTFGMSMIAGIILYLVRPADSLELSRRRVTIETRGNIS